MQKQRTKNKLFAGLMGFLTAFSPVISVVPVYADEDDDINISSVSSDDGIQVSSVETNTVSIDIGDVHGELVINEDQEDEQTVRVSESGPEDDRVKKATVTDADGLVTEAVIDSENPYALVLTEETGKVVTVKAVADSGYDVSQYSVLMDTGKTVMDEMNTDFETDTYASFEYSFTVKYDTVMNVSFDESDSILIDSNIVINDEKDGIEVDSEEIQIEAEDAEVEIDVDDAGFVSESESEADVSDDMEISVEAETDDVSVETEDAEGEGQIIIEMDEQADDFASVFLGNDMDTGDLNASDFVSMRLIVLAEDPSVIIDPEDVIGQYDTIYLLQYTSVQQAMNAYVYYAGVADAVEPDKDVEMATDTDDIDVAVVTDIDDDIESATVSETVNDDDISVVLAAEDETSAATEDTIVIETDAPAVTEDDNPISALNDMMEDAEPVVSKTPVIALIDTGASEGANVIDRVTVFNDDVLSGNGHADKMVAAIVSQDADAKILSIRAMNDSGFGNISSLVAAMEYAIANEVDIINLSLYSRSSLSTSVLKSEILKAVEAGIIVVGSAGNDGADVADYMPGSVEEAYIIGAAEADGSRLPLSNYGSTVDYNVVAGSTSEAAALFTGFISANGLDMVSVAVNNNGLIYDADYIAVEEHNNGMFNEDNKTDMFVRVAYTFVDASKVDSSTKIDAVMDDIMTGDSSYLYTVYGTSMIYDIGEGKHAFRFDAMLKNHITSAYLDDYAIANGNNNGETVSADKAYADMPNGIGYIADASVLSMGEGDYANLVLQVLVPIDATSYQPYVSVNLTLADGETGTKLISYDPNSVLNVVLPVEGIESQLTVDDFTVIVNDDVVIDNSELEWDDVNNCLLINSCITPVVWKVDIVLSAESTDLFRVALNDHKTQLNNISGYTTPKYSLWFKEGTDTSVLDRAYSSNIIGVGDGATGYGLIPSKGFAGQGYVYNTFPKGSTMDGEGCNTPIAIPLYVKFGSDTQVLDMLDKDKNPISDPTMYSGYGAYFARLNALDVAVVFPSYCLHVSYGSYTNDEHGSWGNLAEGPVYFRVIDKSTSSSGIITYTIAYIGGRVNDYASYWGGNWGTVGQFSGGVFQVKSAETAKAEFKLTKAALTPSTKIPGTDTTFKSWGDAHDTKFYDADCGAYTDMSATFIATVDDTNYTLKTTSAGKLDTTTKQYTKFKKAIDAKALAAKKANKTSFTIKVQEKTAPTGYLLCSPENVLRYSSKYITPSQKSKAFSDELHLDDWATGFTATFVADSNKKTYSCELKCLDPSCGDPNLVAFVKQSSSTAGLVNDPAFLNTRFKLNYLGNSASTSEVKATVVLKPIKVEVPTASGSANIYYLVDIGNPDCIVSSGTTSSFVSACTMYNGGHLYYPDGYYSFEESIAPSGYAPIDSFTFELKHDQNGNLSKNTFQSQLKKATSGTSKSMELNGFVVSYIMDEVAYAMPVAIGKTFDGKANPVEGTTFDGIQFGIYNYTKDADGNGITVRYDSNNNGEVASSEKTAAYGKIVGSKLDFKDAVKKDGYYTVTTPFGLAPGTYCVYETNGNSDYVLTDRHVLWFTITDKDVQAYHDASKKADAVGKLYLGSDDDNLSTKLVSTAGLDPDKLSKGDAYTEGEGLWKFGLWNNIAAYFGGLDLTKVDYLKETIKKTGGDADAKLKDAKFAVIASENAMGHDWIYLRKDHNLASTSTKISTDFNKVSIKSFGTNPTYDTLYTEYAKYVKGESSQVAGVITTNASGNATTSVKALQNGTYYVIEVEAPAGYEVNKDYVGRAVLNTKTTEGYMVHTTNIKSSDVSSTKESENVKTGGITVQKEDAFTRTSVAEGDATLAGAEFTIVNASEQTAVNYKHEEIVTAKDVLGSNISYSSVLQVAKQSKYVMDVITTDKHGIATTHVHSCSVSGCDYAGKDGLPYGVYYIIETAPTSAGYLMNKGWVGKITVDKDGKSTLTKVAGSSGSDSSKVSETVYTAKIALEKIDYMRNSNVDHADANLAGATFAVINASEASVQNYQATLVESVAGKGITDTNATYDNLKKLIGDKPVEGKDYVMEILTTNKSGDAVSRDRSDGQGNGGFPYGTYYIIELTAPDGYDVNKSFVAKVVVRADGVVYSFNQTGTYKYAPLYGSVTTIAGNGTTQARPAELIHTGKAEVQKIDVMLGNSNAHGDTDLSGAQFTIVNASKAPAVNYKHQTINTTGLTDSGITYASVLGYANDTKYVMDVITTDKNGRAVTHSHADAKCDKVCKDSEGLPYGVYYIIETKPATYYDLNKTWVGKIVVDKDGKTTQTTVAGGPVSDTKVKQQIWTAKVEIEKIDFMLNDNEDHADTNLAGAEFAIVNGSKSASVNYNDVVVDTVAAKGITSDNAATYNALIALTGKDPSAGKNYVMDVITTNKDGYAVSHTHGDVNCTSEWKDELSLPAGTYYIIETKAPTGYHLNTEWVAKVVVRKDGVTYSFSDNAADKYSVIHGVEKAITGNGDTKLRTPDLIMTGGVEVNKVDYMRDSTNPHGDADLSGAEFKIINASVTKAVNWQHKVIETTGLSGTKVTYADIAKYTGNAKYVMDTIVTDKSGHAVTHTHADAKCDKMCAESDGLPYGTYYIVETKAPVGYFLNTDWVGMIVVREEGTTFTIIQNTEYHRTINHTMNGITKEHTTWGTLGLAGGDPVIDEKGVRDQIYRSGISLNKIDIEMKDATTQGMAEFEGAEFTIINASKAVIRNYEDRDIPTAVDLIGTNPTWSTLAKIAYGDSIGNEKHEASQYVAQVIYTDAYGFASTGKHDLPYGTYYVIETKAPDGYFIDDQFVGKIVVREDNAKLQLGTTTDKGSSFVDINDLKSAFANTVDEQVRRGDLAYQKVDEDGIVKVHVPFLLSAVRINADGTETVLESHIVVTDEQGYIWTGRNAHSQNTNMLDGCLVGNSKFVASASVLSKYNVSSEAELLAYAADNMGTWFQGNSMTYPKDAIDDTYGALYQCYYRLTELQCDSNRSYEENLVNSPRLWVTNDTVNYYTPMKALNTDFASRFASLKSNYMSADADTKEPKYVRWQNYVTTVSADVGNVELWSWTTRLVDKQIVAESEALDVESNTHTVPVRASAAVTDTVNYGHLDSDHKYKLATQFIDLTTGKTLRILSTNADNEVLTKDQTWVTKEFQPTAKRSTIITYTGEEDDLTVHVNLDTRGLEGHTLMAVDYLYEYMDITTSDEVNGDWVLVKIHPADGEYPDSQKLYVPDIHSYAVDAWTEDRAGAKRTDDAVIENLEYMNLSAGEDYIFVTDLVNAATGESLLTKPVEYTFHYNVNEMSTPIADSLQMPVMEIDSSKFTDNMTAVAVTSLYRESRGEKVGEPIVTHTNLADEDETIRWIDVYTNASDDQTLDDVGTDADVATVYDTVKLENVIFDKDDHEGNYTYDLKGTLVFQKDFTDKNGVAHKQGDTVDTLDGTQNEVHIAMDASGNVTFTYADGTTAKGKVLEMTYGSNVAKYVDETKVGDNAYIRDNDAMICDLTVEMIFKVNSNVLAGGTVAVFEDLYHDAAGTNLVLVADHKDIYDEGQTVHYPDVHTTAIDSQTKDDVGACIEHEKIIDTVALDNLIPGRNYVVNGTLMDQATGEPIRVNGKLITQSANVHVNEDGTITSGNGEKIVIIDYDAELHEVDATIDLTFEFDARALQGRTVVVFEDLVHNNITVASHADIYDEGQTVHYPEIHTSAVDAFTQDNVGTVVDEKGLVIDDNGTKTDVSVIIDHVAYDNLVKGKTYTVTGTLMDQKTGYVYVDGDGKEVVVSRTFVAGTTEDGLTAVIDNEHNSVSGVVDLRYEFNGSNVEGTTLVVFEDIYHNDVYLTSHADIKDKAQTVHFPKLRTSAINVETGDEVGSVSEMKIKDFVSVWNLPFDRDYVLKGVLVDKQTGEFLKDADGNIITAENPFHVNEDGTVDNCCEIPCQCKGGTCTCEDWAVCVEDIDLENGDTDGHVHIVFNVDASDLAGHDIVVYEYLYHNDVIVARHTDINDLNQTIHIPDIRTSAVDIKTGDHAGTVEETAIVNDSVYYENLVVGREYTIKGILMNQATNAPVLNEDGTLVRAEATFKAVAESDEDINVVTEYNEADNSVSGYYVLSFELNSTQLKGKTVVVFEDLYHNGVKLVTHAEILDKDQSVHYPDIHTNAVDSSTGDHVGSIWGTLINGVKHLLGNEDADHNGIADNVQQNIIDTVSLNNLVPGYTYVVSGKLYDVEASMNSESPVPAVVDGNEIVQAVTITVAANGRSITASNGAKTTVTDFDMQKYTVSGTVDLTYTLDSSKVQDTKLVVFEDLYHDVTYTPDMNPDSVKPEDIIDTHSDIHDEGQSVSDIGIKTTAVDSQTKAHVGMVPSEDTPYVVIRDEVNVTKLVPSMEYTVKGVLVDINASDFANGKVVYLKADGTTTEMRSDAYEEQVGFKAVETEEIHYLNFALSSDHVQGKAITVFEEIYHNGIMISAHPANSTPESWDENSFKNQTVYYPTGKTNATDDKLGTHTSYASADRVIVDRVYFENLLADEVYTITGTMMYESDFTDADGVVHAKGSAVDMDSSSVRFKVSAGMTEAEYLDADGEATGRMAAMDTVTATTLENGQVVVSGYVSIEFVVDADKLAGATIVAFEDFENRGVKVFTHADLNDLPETIRIPKIHTNAYTSDIDEASVYDVNGNFKDITIVDTVTYENVWTPAELLEMKEQGKAVRYLDGTYRSESSDIYTIDEVLTYVMKGVLMDKETGDVLTNADGEAYIAYSEPFSPVANNGTIDVTFIVNGADFVKEGFSESDLEGKTVVAFEYMYQAVSADDTGENNLVADHTNINDSEQDIRFPKARTHASDGLDTSYEFEGHMIPMKNSLLDDHNAHKTTTSHEVFANETIEIVDYVSVENLHGATVYTVTGDLMVVTGVDENGNTIYEPAKDDSGNAITSTVEFDTNELSNDYNASVNGYVPVVFKFSGVNLAGKTTVAFETLRRDGKLIAVHADIDDAPQTIYLPAIHTNAFDGLSGLQITLADGTTVILDKVSYENLEYGKTYKMTGTLHDQSDGSEVRDASTEGVFVAGVDDQIIMAGGTKVMTLDEFRKAYGDLHVYSGSSDDVYEPVKAEIYSGSDGVVAPATPSSDDQTTNDSELDINSKSEFLVGVDIPAGFYKVTPTATVYNEDGYGYWALYKDNSGNTLDNTITNDNLFGDDVSYLQLVDGMLFQISVNGIDGKQQIAWETVDRDICMANMNPVLYQYLYGADGILVEHEAEAYAEAENDLPAETDLVVDSGSDGSDVTIEPTGVGADVKDVVGGDMTNRVSGEVYVAIVVNTADMNGKTLVAYERLSALNDDSKDKVLAVHEDIEDEAQTVYIPAIHTVATYTDGSKRSGAAVYMTMVDTVEYQNLIPGVEYTMHADLYDKQTGKYLGFGNEVTFTPEDSFGSVDVEIEFDGHEIAGRSVVAFETLTTVGNGEAYIVAEHKDLNDADQTIDILVPAIGTQALYKNETKKAGADAHMTVVDTVRFENLTPGVEYTLYGQLYDQSTGEPVSDVAFKVFTPDVVSGYTTIEIPFDGSRLGDKSVVAFETLTAVDRDGKNYIVAEHKDINDAAQMVDVLQPAIGTTARFADDKKATGASAAMVVYDTVAYVNLTPGTEYTVEAQLFDNELAAGAEDYTSVSEIATMKFTPETTEGSFVIEIPFDGSKLGGHHVVAFETLKAEDSHGEIYVVADHKDINDCNQTVTILQPSIGTKAVFKGGEKAVGASANMTVVDTVKFKDLTPGVEYMLYGQLFDNADEQAVSDIASVTFVPETIDGETTIEIPFDGSALAGHHVVAFETVMTKDSNGEMYVVAEHKDINDCNQTVTILGPSIGTTATFADGGKVGAAGLKMVVVDTVKFEDLTPGVEYTLEGQMMDKADGKAVSDVAITTFKPETANGETTIEIPFDGSALAGHSVVAFETLKAVNSDGEVYVVAEHKDINDANQTVSIVKPEIGTTATFENGEKSAEAASKMTVIDTVAYRNLTPGVEYTLAGELMYKDDGKTTGITGTAKFTPESADGTATVTFTFDGTQLVGKQLVAFETLTSADADGKDYIVAEHKDINDAAQTVTITQPGTDRTTPDIDTSDMSMTAYVIGGLMMMILLAGIVVLRKKNEQI